MSKETRTYRKLSAWAGLFGSGALFVDEHSLISVRSTGYEEQVKRFQFQDIQAIVVSKSRRFGVSLRVILGALLLLLAILVTSTILPAITKALWALAGVLVIAWFAISIGASCRCRVYTAVSQEELLSIRRPWTASKVVAELTPLIEAAQGTLPSGWAESIAPDRSFQLGAAAQLGRAGVKTRPEAGHAEATEAGGSRFSASMLLVLSLFLDAALTAWDLQRAQALPNWMGSTLALIEAAAAVWVLIQSRGVNVSLQRLGIAVLIFLGLAYYGQFGIIAIANSQAKRPLGTVEMRAAPVHRTYLELYVAGCFALGILGAFLTLAGPTRRGQRVLAD
jgi:hypothetical protein